MQNNFLKRTCLAMMLVFTFGCSSNPVNDTNTVDAEPKITFFDSKVFDTSLGKKLNSGEEEVKITFEGDIKLDKIPERMDNWISLINDEGGKIDVVKVDDQGLPARGFVMDAIELVFRGVDYLKKSELFGGAKNYNATIYYKQNGVISEVVLSKK